MKIEDKIQGIVDKHTQFINTSLGSSGYRDWYSYETEMIEALSNLIQEERKDAFEEGKKWQVDFENSLPSIEGAKPYGKNDTPKYVVNNREITLEELKKLKVITQDNIAFIEVIPLKAQIDKIRRDAVEGFVEWYNGEKLFKNVKRMVELKYVEEYLKEDK